MLVRWKRRLHGVCRDPVVCELIYCLVDDLVKTYTSLDSDSDAMLLGQLWLHLQSTAFRPRVTILRLKVDETGKKKGGWSGILIESDVLASQVAPPSSTIGVLLPRACHIQLVNIESYKKLLNHFNHQRRDHSTQRFRFTESSKSQSKCRPFHHTTTSSNAWVTTISSTTTSQN